MNREKYLPIGSVVLLKNGKKRVMVTGFAATALEAENPRMYDYMGCLYPEGVISSDKNLLFDHNQIDQIYYIGYIDEEWKKTEAKIKEIVQKRLSEESKDVGTKAVEEGLKQENIFNNTTDLFN